MTTTHNNETRALSADPAKAMQDMMSTLDALRNVYAEETLALKSSDSPAFFALQEKKINVAQQYHDHLSDFVARKDEMLMVHPDMKSLLRKKQDEFSKTTQENLDALERMRRTVDRLGARIMKAARDTAARDSVTYGARGSMSSYRNKPVTMGVNESA